jgi:hypothetical protein
MPLELIAGFVAGLAYGWLVGRINSSGANAELKSLAGWSGTIVAAVSLALLAIGSAWAVVAIAFMFGWWAGDMPANLREMRKRGKLEDLVEGWWRSEFSESEMKRAFSEHGIDQRVYAMMKRDLRRRFGADFMQEFETQFGFGTQPTQPAAAQPIG